MKFGNYECTSIGMGYFYIDGGAMFGIVPKVLWEKQTPADAKNRIQMNMRSLLIRGNGKTILVDAGIGTKLTDKEKTIYGFEEEMGNMDAVLARQNLTPDDITDVIITHLHFDHAGGATYIENGELRPTFPNATYYIQKAQWETAMNPHSRDKNSFPAINFKPLKEAGVLTLLDGPGELSDGIELLVTHGHTAAQQHPLIKGADKSLFYCADLIPMAAHIPLSWIMAYDNLPMTIMEEKQAVLERAYKENWVLVFEHECGITAATVQRGSKGIEIKKTIVL
ncbi:MBL fold metallo-hydrolase [Desulfococcaceae bacterium HSG9]|nr:MBL fold metallo-hydrolase [Desulfococcaceae bacterium HSG9]